MRKSNTTRRGREGEKRERGSLGPSSRGACRSSFFYRGPPSSFLPLFLIVSALIVPPARRGEERGKREFPTVLLLLPLFP